MANWTLEKATEFSFPHLTVFRKLRDGVPTAWLVQANDGYVMYDPNDHSVTVDPETMKEIAYTYYFKEMHCPLDFNFESFAPVITEEVQSNGE